MNRPASPSSPLVEQDLFDALAKMYPCRWDGKDIIVMDEIRIKEPYTFDDCIGGNNFPDALDRIRKQVGGANYPLPPSTRV